MRTIKDIQQDMDNVGKEFFPSRVKYEALQSELRKAEKRQSRMKFSEWWLMFKLDMAINCAIYITDRLFFTDKPELRKASDYAREAQSSLYDSRYQLRCYVKRRNTPKEPDNA